MKTKLICENSHYSVSKIIDVEEPFYTVHPVKWRGGSFDLYNTGKGLCVKSSSVSNKEKELIINSVNIHNIMVNLQNHNKFIFNDMTFTQFFDWVLGLYLQLNNEFNYSALY